MERNTSLNYVLHLESNPQFAVVDREPQRL